MKVSGGNKNSEKLREVTEMRLMLSFLSKKAKENIVKGMSMFEAGYKAGYLDGINSRLNEKISSHWEEF